MAAPYKASAIAQQLVSAFQTRGYSSLGIVQSTTAAGDPTIYVGTGVAGTANICIVITSLPSTPADLNILGSTGFQYSPALVKFATEAFTSGGAGADCLTPQQLLDFTNICTQQGARSDWYQSAAAAAPSTTTFDTASNKKAEWYPDAIWKNLSST